MGSGPGAADRLPLATDAPSHWPAVRAARWDKEAPSLNLITVAAELARAFEAEGVDHTLSMAQSVLLDDGVLELPLLVEEAGQQRAVFVYAEADAAAAAHYAGARAALQRLGAAPPVYYAPAALPAGVAPAAVVRRLDPSQFSRPEHTPSGTYACWWPTPAQPRLEGAPAVDALLRVARATEGRASLLFTAFVNDLELMDKAPEALVALPSVPLEQHVGAPGGIPALLRASRESGLSLACHTETPPRERDRLLALFADLAEWFAAELERQGIPAVDADEGIAAWWERALATAIEAEQVRGEGAPLLATVTLAEESEGAPVPPTHPPSGRPGDALAALVFDALELAQQTLRAGDALAPVLLTRTGDETATQRFVLGDAEWGLRAARRVASEQPASVERCALVYDGYLTIEGEKVDALIAEGHERGAPRSWLFGQRYRRPRPKQLELIGNPLLFGEEAPLLR